MNEIAYWGRSYISPFDARFNPRLYSVARPASTSRGELDPMREKVESDLFVNRRGSKTRDFTNFINTIDFYWHL